MHVSEDIYKVREEDLNALEAALSTMYLTMKYPMGNVQVGVVKSDQGLARKCYKDSLKLKKVQSKGSRRSNELKINMIDIDPRDDT